MENTFELNSDKVNIEKIMEDIRRDIEKRKQEGRYYEEEIQQIAQAKLEKIYKAPDLDMEILQEFHSAEGKWNISVRHQIKSHRKGIGRLIVLFKRKIVRPLIRWFIEFTEENFKRQYWLNFYYAHILHNLTFELTKSEIEKKNLEHRILHLEGELEILKKREKALEELVFPPEKQQ